MNTKIVTLDHAALAGAIHRLAADRPYLAKFVLDGQSSYTEDGNTYVLRSSPAEHEARLEPPALITRELEPSGSPLSRLAEEIRAEQRAERGGDISSPMPAKSEQRTTPELTEQSEPPKKTGEKLKALLDGDGGGERLPHETKRAIGETTQELRIRNQREADARRAKTQGRVPAKGSKLRKLFEGNDPEAA